jgi:hypothetical protein
VQKENSAPETVGVVVPDDVKLYPLPPEVVQKVPQARSHMFFVKDDEAILVSSSDRRVRCNQKEIDRLGNSVGVLMSPSGRKRTFRYV